MRIVIAFKAFFAALSSRDASLRISSAMEPAKNISVSEASKSKPTTKQPSETVGQSSTSATASEKASQGTALSSKTSSRSDALTLLSTLQREARLIDLIQEPLDEYTDEQVGAAARDVLRESSKVLHRLFAIKRLAEGVEGDSIEVPKNASSAIWKITGKSGSKSSDGEASLLKGNLIHAGWLATQVAVPSWSGSPEEATVIAPAEVEAK